MAVILESGTSIKRWRGLSSDTKPRFTQDGEKRTAIPPMSVFREIDTGRHYVWSDRDGWEPQEQTIEGLLAAVNEHLGQLVVLQRQANVGLGAYLGIDLSES